LVPPPVAQAPAAGNLGPLSVAGRLSLQRGGVAGGSVRLVVVVGLVVVVVGGFGSGVARDEPG
jgi:hypothetical protein